MSLYEHETQSSDVDQTDAPSLPEMSEYLLAMRHELRAPLNAIIGMSALLLDDDVTPRQAQYVKSVHAAGESLSVILNDVLDLANVAANRLAIEPIPFDLKSMIEETASALTPKANERGLALRVDWRPELPRYLVGDPGRTRQVIGNLVGYAVNGTTHGEVVIRVTPDGERSGIPAIRFSVEDTGIGIAQQRLARIFDEYVPLDASPYRSFGVTGLGLRLSAELVRLMNGVIHAESEPGRGNRLWFSIPMPTAAQYETGAGAEPATTGGGRALIVEADFSNRSRFAQQFQDAGWRVEFTSEIEQVGAQLRQALADGDPYRTCIISHYAVRPVHMELARDLKTDSLLAPVALVMVTAVGSPGDGQKLWNAGFAAYLRKPVPAEEIRESLDALARLGPTGKGNSLITRHSLAEIRNAQSFEVEGIDEMLASLTAPAEPTVEPLESSAPSSDSEQPNSAEHSAAAEVLEAAPTTEAVDTTTTPIEAEAETATADPAPLPESLGALLALPLPEARDVQAAAVEAIDAVDAAETPAVESFEASEAEAARVDHDQATLTPEPVEALASTSETASVLPSEPLLLAAPHTVVNEAPALHDLIGPAVAPAEPAERAPSLSNAESGLLAPPAIAPTQAAAETVTAQAEPEIDSEQLALNVAPPVTDPVTDAVTEPPPIWSETSDDPLVEQSIEASISPDTANEPAAATEPTIDDGAIDQPSAQLPASLIEGHQDALWESEPTIPALDGLVTNADEAIDAPSAVIESVVLASPAELVVTDSTESIITRAEPLVEESEAADVPVASSEADSLVAIAHGASESVELEQVATDPLASSDSSSPALSDSHDSYDAAA
ncbi:MAG: ATP-binding response regulator, partial [Gemmatimonadales bacterium]